MTPRPNDTTAFEQYESNVRSYCRSFPTVFASAKGAVLTDELGRRYLDFFAGAGALNYGHNPDAIRDRLIDYLRSDGVTHSLDMFASAKREFIERFSEWILQPRQLDYKIQFCGPTGANAVEAALKLARLATGRHGVCAFSGGWHGLSAGALAVTSNVDHRAAAGGPLGAATFFPYADGPYQLPDPFGYVEALLSDPGSGLELPAAIILETVQSEGGIYVAPIEWLRSLRRLCDEKGILMIVDDVQAGCGRTGAFFSFERAGIRPDIVCLSKSIGGYGLPMSLVLMRRELDVWKPGQHTGTFRGNQLAFVAATAALEHWRGVEFPAALDRRSRLMERLLRDTIASLAPGIEVRGLGMLWGVDLVKVGGSALAKEVCRRAFEKGLILERCGRDDTVLKLMPPLTIEDEELKRGCEILRGELSGALAQPGSVEAIPAERRPLRVALIA